MNTKVKVVMAALIAMGASACKKEDQCKGEALQGVGCLAVFDPVCGCDGKTYGNDCEAKVAGVKSWTDGACGGVEDE